MEEGRRVHLPDCKASNVVEVQEGSEQVILALSDFRGLFGRELQILEKSLVIENIKLAHFHYNRGSLAPKIKRQICYTSVISGENFFVKKKKLGKIEIATNCRQL